MNIVVTGHLGFIGSNLKQELEKSCKVYGLEKDVYDQPNWQYKVREQLNIIKPAAVFHVGAISDTTHADVESIMTLNWEATTMFSDYCRVVDIPLIYSSTAAIYGDQQGNRNLYAWSKYAGEKHVITNKQIALRYFNVYGPGEQNKGKMASVLHQAFKQYEDGCDFKLFKGDPKRDFVHVKDIVHANLYALKNYFKLDRNYYDVGVGKAVTFEYLMDLAGLKYKYDDTFKIPKNYQYFTQSSQERWMKGWKPLYTVEEGVEHYKNHLWNTTSQDQ
jgi:ADP-L-glycero-D-manno-heptose 6-epimerase